MICPSCKKEVGTYRPFGEASQYIKPHTVKGKHCQSSYKRVEGNDPVMCEQDENCDGRPHANYDLGGES